jgi:3'-phosphoadenosine 5'-phosphosulfate sulfotransferase (PAPS reductase)/FAD synthetase
MSTKYDGFVDLAVKKKRFPSAKARFCTEELKSKPMIDYVLAQESNLIIYQGIRADESAKRAAMEKQCTFFKYYYEPIYVDKKGNKRKHTYRKKDVFAWREKYNDDIVRPVFTWTGKQVVDYIIAEGHEVNPLYKQGFGRVGCFPCIMARHGEILQIINRYPEAMKEIESGEEKVGRSFFPPDYIPKRFQTGHDEKSGKSFPWSIDVEKYIENKHATIDIFDQDTPSCMSLYGLCE